MFSKDQLSQLNEPIDDQLVCGVYLKLDKSAFRSIRNEFNIAQSALRKLSQNPSEHEVDQLQSHCLEVWGDLATSLFNNFISITRDIELISWFIAAQTLLDNTLESTANSLQWLADLVEQHWEPLNPVIPVEKLISDSDQGQVCEQTKAKINAFSQFMGDSEDSSILYAPLLQFSLLGSVTFYDFQSAEKKGGVPTLKESVALILNGERNAIQEKLNNVMRCRKEIERMETVLAIKTAEANITNASLGFVKNLFFKLDNALQVLSGMAAKKESSITSEPDNANITEASSEEFELLAGENNLLSVTQAREINDVPVLLRNDNLDIIAASNSMNRDLAFRLLRQIADYFHVSEPHSPISFMLEKSIRWGYLPLPELLQEMLKEKSEDKIESIFNTVGLDSKEKIDLPNVN